MRLAVNSVPKINAKEETEENTVGLCFCSAQDAISELLPRLGGKVLLAGDAGAMSALAPFGRSSRTVTVVAEEDALPLFSMPDGIGAVIAAGVAKTLLSARFFAGIRRIPCYLFPVSADLYGVFGKRGKVRLGAHVAEMPLAEGQVFYDASLLGDSFGDGYGALLLARLSLFEDGALCAFRIRTENPCAERAREILTEIAVSPREILQSNAELRRLEGAGLPAGEAFALEGLHRAAGEPLPCWRAFRALTAVYEAFFASGVPRRYFVPDYAARAARAGVERWEISVPTRAEYAARALAFERMRAKMRAEISAIRSATAEYGRVLENLTGEPLPAADLSALKILPERHPGGLCSVIRDFGLLEF